MILSIIQYNYLKYMFYYRHLFNKHIVKHVLCKLLVFKIGLTRNNIKHQKINIYLLYKRKSI